MMGQSQPPDFSRLAEPVPVSRGTAPAGGSRLAPRDVAATFMSRTQLREQDSRLEGAVVK